MNYFYNLQSFYQINFLGEKPAWLLNNDSYYLLSNYYMPEPMLCIIWTVIYEIFLIPLWATSSHFSLERMKFRNVMQNIQDRKFIPMVMLEIWLKPLSVLFHFWKHMLPNCNYISRKISWMEEPGRLQFMGSQSQTRLSD